ncbi:hypothetical protein BKA57DRAFT_107708 [Linnemannia elongata]|nr:hypothetical protein BKA57DRAFT_107708 [Linnemannia elongata]
MRLCQARLPVLRFFPFPYTIALLLTHRHPCEADSTHPLVLSLLPLHTLSKTHRTPLSLPPFTPSLLLSPPFSHFSSYFSLTHFSTTFFSLPFLTTLTHLPVLPSQKKTMVHPGIIAASVLGVVVTGVVIYTILKDEISDMFTSFEKQSPVGAGGGSSQRERRGSGSKQENNDDDYYRGQSSSSSSMYDHHFTDYELRQRRTRSNDNNHDEDEDEKDFDNVSDGSTRPSARLQPMKPDLQIWNGQ